MAISRLKSSANGLRPTRTWAADLTGRKWIINAGAAARCQQIVGKSLGPDNIAQRELPCDNSRSRPDCARPGGFCPVSRQLLAATIAQHKHQNSGYSQPPLVQAQALFTRRSEMVATSMNAVASQAANTV